jgi:hypothetical protein
MNVGRIDLLTILTFSNHGCGISPCLYLTLKTPQLTTVDYITLEDIAFPVVRDALN